MATLTTVTLEFDNMEQWQVLLAIKSLQQNLAVKAIFNLYGLRPDNFRFVTDSGTVLTPAWIEEELKSSPNEALEG